MDLPCELLVTIGFQVGFTGACSFNNPVKLPFLSPNPSQSPLDAQPFQRPLAVGLKRWVLCQPEQPLGEGIVEPDHHRRE